MFQMITTANVEQTHKKKISHVTIPKRFSEWSYDMKGDAEKYVERKCEVETKSVSHRKQGTPFIDDHHLEKNDIQVVGEVGPVCTQILLKCLKLARLGRSHMLWAVNTLARAVTKWNRACHQRLARLIVTCIARRAIDNSVMSVIKLTIESWVCFKTLLLQETCKILN